MEAINEQQDNMKQIQDALSTPVGPAAEFDDVSLQFKPKCVFSRTEAFIFCSSLFLPVVAAVLRLLIVFMKTALCFMYTDKKKSIIYISRFSILFSSLTLNTKCTKILNLLLVQDELEAELEELEDEDLNELEPAPTSRFPTAPQPVRTPAPVAARPASTPAPVPRQKTPAYVNDEDDELQALQKEMAL
jgi:hypothetical protein